MTRRNSATMTAEQVEQHNAKVRGRSGVAVAQLAERRIVAPAVMGSSPIRHPQAPAKKPRMNKTEGEWAMILEARKRAGEILWYQFEGLRLRLADHTYFTPDFPVLTKENNLEFHEVKGFWREAAKVRINVAADRYPFWKFYAVRKIKKKDGGGWDIEGF